MRHLGAGGHRRARRRLPFGSDIAKKAPFRQLGLKGASEYKSYSREFRLVLGELQCGAINAMQEHARDLDVMPDMRSATTAMNLGN